MFVTVVADRQRDHIYRDRRRLLFVMMCYSSQPEHRLILIQGFAFMSERSSSKARIRTVLIDVKRGLFSTVYQNRAVLGQLLKVLFVTCTL